MKSPLTLTFLGTGTSQGIPVIGSSHPVCLSADSKDKRLRASVMLEWDNCVFVIDCGPDFRQQMLSNNVSTLDGLLITHEHSDHTAGIDDIRPFYFKQGNIPFYASEQVFDALKTRFAYIFDTANKYPSAPEIDSHIINKNTTLTLAGKQVTVVEAWHGELAVFGFKIDGLVYLTDVKTMHASEIKKIKNCEVLIVNALREAPHATHFNLEEALAFVEKVNPKRAYFTHISHLLGFHEEVNSKLPSHIKLAYDGLKITL